VDEIQRIYSSLFSSRLRSEGRRRGEREGLTTEMVRHPKVLSDGRPPDISDGIQEVLWLSMRSHAQRGIAKVRSTNNHQRDTDGQCRRAGNETCGRKLLY
jgi:hypothetical protein